MQSAKRARCDNCHFLTEQCVCHWIPVLSTRLKILILQDPKEAQHAKNTVSLLSLGLSSVECISIANHDVLASALRQKDPAKWRLVFPSDSAVAIESIDADSTAEVEGLILIDATWRKAKKFYFIEPLLYAFKAVCFSQAPVGQYSIRKSPGIESLSTLEACAYAIEQVTGENMQPLREFMVVAQEWQWRKQPLSHRHLE
ncbi:MAG: DTW domain-containing protein [Gammaproteobacteria bacterium]|jgi:DTW domain-containing protein YfiP|uniref:tRNA-uridine aminocarboxypropyltransferase n=1 Tax=Marinomonas polaris TaxID=293552 RepID=UPI001D67EC91|nr:DTW domain-containing protein [Gammaproteobacteria bacterium]MBU2022601.1 DTW domain-containing protein [Gammaproteobacteria bacterium]MBU2239205.1 DTW domain-containing protein [Gammaproteobacteria bacterium]MBU2320337.1 DTW domain-containing protein [Gammaproteobacteria bacterium]MBU2414854.1 DTW domain-containing protein [Gammaproteobacteria bacterium]|tara:strand:- start:875 stop:1474 length:600 start_codon:yes stop_codon:yes gene_type:complete